MLNRSYFVVHFLLLISFSALLYIITNRVPLFSSNINLTSIIPTQIYYIIRHTFEFYTLSFIMFKIVFIEMNAD